jgi:FtsZ-binding cell division protein ZapB
MSAFDSLKSTLVELPISDIKARLDFAMDQAAALERQVSELQTKVGQLQAQLEVVTLDRDQLKTELQRLKDEHSEEVRIHCGIEFRRGKRTAGDWITFCPACHLPADTSKGLLQCPNDKCGWSILFPADKLANTIEEL